MLAVQEIVPEYTTSPKIEYNVIFAGESLLKEIVTLSFTGFGVTEILSFAVFSSTLLGCSTLKIYPSESETDAVLFT
jgi:hypothetical protein